MIKQNADAGFCTGTRSEQHRRLGTVTVLLDSNFDPHTHTSCISELDHTCGAMAFMILHVLGVLRTSPLNQQDAGLSIFSGSIHALSIYRHQQLQHHFHRSSWHVNHGTSPVREGPVSHRRSAAGAFSGVISHLRRTSVFLRRVGGRIAAAIRAGRVCRVEQRCRVGSFETVPRPCSESCVVKLRKTPRQGPFG